MHAAIWPQQPTESISQRARHHIMELQGLECRARAQKGAGGWRMKLTSVLLKTYEIFDMIFWRGFTDILTDGSIHSKCCPKDWPYLPHSLPLFQPPAPQGTAWWSTEWESERHRSTLVFASVGASFFKVEIQIERLKLSLKMFHTFCLSNYC